MIDGADIRRLAEYAAQAGADPAWLEATVRTLLEQHLRLGELERAIDRRTLAALETTRKVQALAGRGLTAGAIAKRTGISLPTVYRHLQKNPTA